MKETIYKHIYTAKGKGLSFWVEVELQRLTDSERPDSIDWQLTTSLQSETMKITHNLRSDSIGDWMEELAEDYTQNSEQRYITLWMTTGLPAKNTIAEIPLTSESYYTLMDAVRKAVGRLEEE